MHTVLFRKDEPVVFKELWDQYAKQRTVSPRYILSNIDYYLEQARTLGLLESDQSFILLKNKEPVACCFLPVENEGGMRAVASRAHEYVIAPIFDAEADGKEVFRIIDDIAKKESIAKVMYSVDALEAENYSYNYLIRYGYLDCSLLNYLIDLSLPGDLLSHCRKGHRSDIKRISNDPDFEVFHIDSADPDYEIHEKYREIHRKAAGRATRSKASFDSQFDKLKDGTAVLFGVRYKGKIIAVSYFEMHGKKVLYLSAAEDPEYGKFPLYHSMVFSAMCYYKERGYSFIEVSQPFNPSAQFGYYTDAKQVSIGLFKRGFGGKWVNDYRGIKYFDKDLFSKEAAEFTARYGATLTEQSDE